MKRRARKLVCGRSEGDGGTSRTTNVQESVLKKHAYSSDTPTTLKSLC